MTAPQSMAKPLHPRVSIGLPVYNGEKHLEASIKSIQAQTYSDFELIISDNASTDRTREICEYLSARDPRILYKRNDSNIGLCNNFNYVFSLSSGEYFKWAAADDLCAPQLLERCVSILDTHPDTILAYPKTEFIDESGNALSIESPNWDIQSPSGTDRLKLAIDRFDHVTAFDGLVRASMLRKSFLFPNYYGGDRILLAQLAYYGKFQKASEFEALFLKRIHTKNSTNFQSHSDWFPKQNNLPYWRLWKNYADLVFRTTIPKNKKIVLLSFILRRVYWHKGYIAKELHTHIQTTIANIYKKSQKTSFLE